MSNRHTGIRHWGDESAEGGVAGPMERLEQLDRGEADMASDRVTIGFMVDTSGIEAATAALDELAEKIKAAKALAAGLGIDLNFDAGALTMTVSSDASAEVGQIGIGSRVYIENDDWCMGGAECTVKSLTTMDGKPAAVIVEDGRYLSTGRTVLLSELELRAEQEGAV